MALGLGLPAASAAQTPATTTNQGTTSVTTQNPESHWLTSGYGGSNFARNAQPSSGEFGGSVGYLWKSKFGAEFDAGFTPNFQLQSNFFGLGIKPQINSYMANVIGALPLGADAAWEPYISGGGGAISLRSGNSGAAANFLNPNATKAGGNVGAGLMGFAGNWGFKADVRYFRAAGAYQTTTSGTIPSSSTSTSTSSPTPSPSPSPGPYLTSGATQTAGSEVTSKELVNSALSGLAFWRANFGVALRW